MKYKMGKTNKMGAISLIISIIVIIILAVFIININKIIPAKISDKELNKNKELSINIPVNPSITNTTMSDVSRCFNNYGKSGDTVLFVHSDYCPHCKNMMPIIRDLENEGYKFYWAEGSDSQAEEIITNCFSNLLSGYVPQFICPGNSKEYTGEMDKLTLKKFADDCVSVN